MMAGLGIFQAVGGTVQAVAGWSADALDSALRGNTAPAVVDLGYNRLGSAGFQRVFRALAENTSCKGMSVEGAGVDDAAVGVLAEALRQNRTLVVVHLKDNPISGDGAGALAEALMVNTGLKVLDLENTDVDNAGVDAFVAALPANQTLEHLGLERIPMSDEAAQRLKDAAARSRSLRKLGTAGGSRNFAVTRLLFGGGRRSGASSAAAAEASHAVRRLSSSEFKRVYGLVEAFHDTADLQQGLAQILKAVGDKKGIPRNARNELIQGLSNLIDSRAEGKVMFGAAAVWTSADMMNGITFYGAVQEVLREDRPGRLLNDVVRYCRTFNKFVVCPRQRLAAGLPGLATGLVWAYENDAGRRVPFSTQDGRMLEDAVSRGLRQFTTKDLAWNVMHGTDYTFDFVNMAQINHESRQVRAIHRIDADQVQGALPTGMMTYRGCWIPLVWVEWFTAGVEYRYAGYMPSSEEADMARRFIRMFSPSDTVGKVPVLFQFHFDPQRGCNHLNLLEKYTAVPGEREWLFQHYSAFRVVRAADLRRGYDMNNPVVIELHVFPDSSDVSEDLPLAKWH